MKKLALTTFFILLSSPAWATTFFLAPASSGGNDSNSGTSASSPWLSPNHAVNCGDVIIAAASTSYSASDFGYGKWGPVNCPAGNNVAWLKCVTFDGCKINSPSNHAIAVTSNFWGVQGWETTTGGSTFGCFVAAPLNSSTSVHHIIFANDIANGCSGGGFTSFNDGTAGVDYLAYVGVIAYNAAQGSSECFSGLNVFQPVAHDTAPGTHIYIAGSFSYSNVDPSPCAGGTPTDGEGIIFDTFDGRDTGGLSVYTQQAVAFNNMLLSNGSHGFEVYASTNGSTHAPIIAYQNTAWGNNHDTRLNNSSCGEFDVISAYHVTETNNLGMTNTPTGCGFNPIYAFYVANGQTEVVNNNWGYSATGTNAGISNTSGFSYGSSNLFGSNPNFSNPTTPGAPTCGSATSVPNCMATVVANFTPATVAAKAYGYQVPSTTPTSDPLFPQWLCNVNLPDGLVTLGCASSSSLPVPPTNVSITIN
jgi:hypothetical protein